jgi:thiol-disulfide isomerase/thioredoxin
MPALFRSSALLALAAAAVVALTACSGGTDAVDQSAGGQFRYVGTTAHGKTIAESQRKTVGDVSGELINGGQFNLDANKGKVTVLNFWASWCVPCQTESPQFDTLYQKLHPSGVDFVGLDVKENNKNAPLSFIKDNDITYPNVYDQKAQTALQIGKLPLSIGLPWTVVVDKNLKVAAVYSGTQEPADLEPVLQSLLAES